MRLWILVIVLLAPVAALPAGAEAPDADSFPEPDSARLHEIDDYQDPEDRSAYFEWSWLDEKIAPWQDFKDRVNEEWGLDFFIGYSPQFQAGTQEHKRQTVADEWDLIGEWRVVDSETFGKGRAQFWFLRVLTLGDNRGAQFQEGVGSLWELNDIDTGNKDHLNAIGMLWWEQLMFEDHFRVVVGKLDPRLLMNKNRYMWDDRVLFNMETLASDPVNPVNGSRALGTFAEINFGGFYVSGLWVDADSHTNSIDFSSLDNGRYSWSAEVGFETTLGDLGEGNYRTSWFKTESTGSGSDSDKSGMGYSISIDQDIGDNFALFGYWAYRTGRNGPLKQNLSTGLMMRKPFGIAHDLVGLGFTWGTPDGGDNKDDQFGLEAFWRMQVIDRVEFTPLLQYIIKPANSSTDTRLVGGLRLRIYL